MPRPTDSRTSYVPAIDGLRTIAVAAVILYHLDPAWLPGGLLGVAVFFTLSGYLITSNLMRSYHRGRGLGLPTFWLRRFRRLVPAVVLLVAVSVVLTLMFDHANIAKASGEGLSSLFYVNNWHMIIAGQSYFDRFAGLGVFDHMWSLSVEEQFYLFWPLILWVLLFLARGRRFVTAGATTVLALLSFAWMAYLASGHPDDPTRIYEGTDTRAGGLLLGAALAILLAKAQGSRRVPRVLAEVGGWVGLVVVLAMMWLVPDYTLFLYQGGLLLLSIATIGVILGAVNQRSTLSRALGIGPLRWIGERSYGIYLWHLPIIVFLPEWTNVPAWARGLLAAVLAVVLAALSWSMVEDPIRRRGVVAPLRQWWASAVEAYRSPSEHVRLPRTALAAGSVAATGLVLVGIPAAWNGSLNHSAASAPNNSTPPVMEQKIDGEQEAQQPVDGVNEQEAMRCDTVIHVGDSTSIGMFSDEYLNDPQRNAAVVYRAYGASTVIAVNQGARATIEALEGDPTIEDSVVEQAATEHEGQTCWVIGSGVNDAANRAVGHSTGEAERIDTIMKHIKSDDLVLWPTAVTNRTSGPYANENMAPFNEALREAPSRYPNLVVYDWASDVRPEWFLEGDDVHYNAEGNGQRSECFARALAAAFPREGDIPESHEVRVMD